MNIVPSDGSKTLSDAQRLQDKPIYGLINEFLRTKKSSQTVKAYKSDILAFFKAISVSTTHELISIPIYELSNIIINYTESFKKSEEYRADRIINPRTVNRKAYALSSFFEFLVGTYWYPRNPVKIFTPYSTPSRTSTHDMTKDELNAIWTYVQELAHLSQQKPKKMLSSWQQMLIIWLLMLSLRRNEAANLKWDDWDRTKNILTVFGKWQKYKYLPVPKKISNYLETYQNLKTTHGYESNYIFSPINNNRTWDTNKPITWTYIFNTIKKITQHLQNDWLIDPEKTLTPHSFRTTFVKLALDKHATDIEIMNATGHSTSQMVKYYDSRSPIEVNAANDMDDIF